ncbi:MAG: acyl-CoA dehydrogenase family protein [SAR324 cluster bacterium]|nr:acyl-CoA dehydrogenase family protein [SAR324 cluster bacterium]|tara:strand:- start:6513 stop:7691 length:1179 start_codon:yes stop_codon:yes gene_type:complete
MDFSLSHEQKMLVETVREFIVSELQPLEEEIEHSGMLDPDLAEDIKKKSLQLGLFAMNVPKTFGGVGLSTLDWILAEEQFGHTTDILIRRAFGNVYDILFEGTQEQVERWLLPCVRGDRVFSVAFTEPEAGSDAASIRTRAVKNSGGWCISGKKHFISDGAFSDFFVITAVTGPEQGHRGISTFIIDKNTPGVTVGRDQPMMGLRGTSHVELFFDEVQLGPEHLLGEEGRGLMLALETLGRIRLAQVCARAVGKATKIFQLSTEFASQRTQFGQTLDQFQQIQQMLADSAIEINAARLAVLQTAWEADQGKDVKARISMAKVQASETLGRVADRGVQIFGGLGYCKDLPMERYFRDSRIYRIYDGTSEIHRTVIAKALSRGENSLFNLSLTS